MKRIKQNEAVESQSKVHQQSFWPEMIGIECEREKWKENRNDSIRDREREMKRSRETELRLVQPKLSSKSMSLFPLLTVSCVRL